MYLKNNFFSNYKIFLKWLFYTEKNGIGGIMLSVFISSAVDCDFEPRSDQTKEYRFGIGCLSAKFTL